MNWLIDRSPEQTDEENHPHKEELVMSPLRPGVCSVTALSSHGLQANTKSPEMLHKPGAGSGYREQGHNTALTTALSQLPSQMQPSHSYPLISAPSDRGVGGSQGLEGPSAVAKALLRSQKPPAAGVGNRALLPHSSAGAAAAPHSPILMVSVAWPAKPWASRATPAPPLLRAPPRDQNP